MGPGAPDRMFVVCGQMDNVVDGETNHDDHGNRFRQSELPTLEDHDSHNANDNNANTKNSQNWKQNISCGKK